MQLKFALSIAKFYFEALNFNEQFTKSHIQQLISLGSYIGDEHSNTHNVIYK